MTLEEKIAKYKDQYDVIGIVDLDHWYNLKIYQREPWLKDELKKLHRESYQQSQRILFTMSIENASDNNDVGNIVKTLQYYLNEIDITNFFVVLLTNQPLEKIAVIKQWLLNNSRDQTSITIDMFDAPIQLPPTVGKDKAKYRYNSVDPLKIKINDLSEREQFLLMESDTFCIYPWIHLHAYPTGQTYPCCGSEMNKPVGNVKNNTLKEIWNSDAQKQLRVNMLNEVMSPGCGRCYEQDAAGFFSMRRSANKHHGHQIKRVQETAPDGTYENFQMTYWDIRFSNLCNLKCRSCGHIFSSQWYQDQVKLAGPEWRDKNKVLNYAGRTEMDMWEQLEPHLEHVEQIYFAGGEPLLMEEHYRILEELVQRKMFHVRLIYNTNFTHTELKGKSVFEYWKLFDSVAVGASLDDSGARGEYIRKGTEWAVVEQNRLEMMKTCPNVDFYISPTLSIMNVWHLPDFHRDWVERGLIRAQDLNVNILQDPAHYRIDIATAEYKEQLATKYLNHIDWLRERDPLQRATVGFESAMNFMAATDNTHLIDTFWLKTNQLDEIRKENILDIIPELAALK